MIPARGFYCIRAAAENEACLQAFLLCGQAGGRSGFRIDLIRMPEEPRGLDRRGICRAVNEGWYREMTENLPESCWGDGRRSPEGCRGEMPGNSRENIMEIQPEKSLKMDQ